VGEQLEVLIDAVCAMDVTTPARLSGTGWVGVLFL